ncbi:helix-turn-helix domain-containing protein [Paratissierella segnis]|jgi:transcriptional regulator with XRE-family HTH domain|nr:helix-turn-helix transcriptional regulator [Paratissierella segnis]
MTFNKLTFEEQAIISMKRKNMTLGDVAKKLNISIPYVSDIIKGNRKAEKYRSKIVELLEIKE